AWATHVVVFPTAQRVLMAAARLMDVPGRYSTLLAVGVGSVLAAVLGYGGWRFQALLSSRPLSPEAYEIPLSLLPADRARDAAPGPGDERGLDPARPHRHVLLRDVQRAVGRGGHPARAQRGRGR